MDRLNDLRRFYDLLTALGKKLGGKRMLETCNGRLGWPKRGVYFFFEPGENRIHSGEGPRVVRVGTHALTSTSQTTLWNRLSQHQGTIKGSGATAVRSFACTQAQPCSNRIPGRKRSNPPGAKVPAPASPYARLKRRWSKPSAGIFARCRFSGWLWKMHPAPTACAV